MTNAVKNPEAALKIKNQVMILSDELMNYYVDLNKKLMSGDIGGADILGALPMVKHELDSLKRRLGLGEISDIALASAKIQIRDGLGNVLSSGAVDQPLQNMIQSFIDDELAFQFLDRPGYRFSQDWFTYHTDQWTADFGHLAGKERLRFLEIGSFEGMSTCWTLANMLTHPTSVIHCIDTFHIYPKQEENFDHNIEQTGAAYKVTKLRGLSHEALRLLTPSSYDFIYVDGSHLGVDVIQDAVLSWPLLKRGGFLVFDDYEYYVPQVFGIWAKPAIDAFLSMFAQQFELIHQGWQVAIKKLV
jgi:hypothetical protein